MPHHCARCLRSVMASKTRAGGAAMKISARTTSLSVGRVAVVNSAPEITEFASFGESLQPGEEQRPADAVALGLIDVAGESAVREPDQRAVALGVELPQHFGDGRHPAGTPSVCEAAWWIDFEELAVDREITIFRRHTSCGPLTANTYVHVEVVEVILVFAAPP